jgi:hypothetical protein
MFDHFFFVKDSPIPALPHRPTYGSKPKMMEWFTLGEYIMYALFVVMYINGNGI